LGGAPGIYSARYSGDRDDRSNYLKLLQDMAHQRDRSARFICCLVLVRHWQDPTPVICQGDWLGDIATEPSGQQGFGYDPIFLPKGLTMSAAELSKSEKSAISHRGKAVNQLKQFLSQHPTWLTPGG
jgi:XTP/dITP diphosphohydrolase